MNRRRNETSAAPLQSRKAEMTSGVSSVGSNQNKASSNPQLPGLSGARPTSSSTSIADGPLRAGSVATQPATRAESTNSVLPLRPSIVSCIPSNSTKKVTRNHSKPAARISTTSAFAPSRPFHPTSVDVLVLQDNPDLKVESQPSSADGTPLVDGAVSAGLADSSSLCDTDTNYVVFDYPEALNEPDHYTRVVVEEEVIESIEQDVMGTYPDGGYTSEKSPDDATSADVPHHHSKEDDLLDDFFKFVSNGKFFNTFFFVF